MEIIVLKGGTSVGKTTTIIDVYKELINNRGYMPAPKMYRDLYNKDFIDVIVDPTSGDKIGIVSQGDYARKPKFSVKDHLNYLVSAGCAKSVCAWTLDRPTIAHTINNYKHYIVDKYSADNIDNARAKIEILTYL